MLCDKSVENQENDARDEEKERERGHVIELGPEFIALRTARWYALFNLVTCQSDDWTAMFIKERNI